MKYLKLYEAFSSNTLSKLYKHLKKKNATKTSLTQFKSDMKSITSSFDIPMDQISDDDVSYLSRRKALGLRNDEKVENRFGIWAIKFWFDKDGEYIGTSGTGNETFTAEIPAKTGKQCKPFDQDQWSYLKSFQKTGILKPVLEEDYANLKDGDEVVGVLVDPDSYEDQKIDNLTLGRIFIDDDGERYIVHDNSEADGLSPDNDPSDIHPNIEWGSYAWKIHGRNRVAEDHFNLHQVLKSDSPLKYYSEKKEMVNDLYEFNLSLEEDEDGVVRMVGWSGNYEEKNKIEKEADFAVILYVDGILSRGLKSPKEKSVEREESRKGAVALMTDEEFKRVNLERIMNKVVEKIGVTPESVELKSLQKVVANIVSSGISESYAFLGIITRDYRSIDSFSYQIKRLVSCLSVEGGETMLSFVYGAFAKEYRRIKRQSSEAYRNKKAAMDVLKERPELKPLHDAIIGISAKITKSILSKEIARGEDLKKLFFKLGSIEDMTRDDDFIFTYRLRDFIDSIRYAASSSEHIRTKVDKLIGNYCDLESEDGKTDLQRDLGRLREIESYVEDIFGI